MFSLDRLLGGLPVVFSLAGEWLGRKAVTGADDPYPKLAFLTVAQVKGLLGIRGRADWTAFLDSTPHFPRMVQCGLTQQKKPRMRYKKEQVYGYIDLVG